jgi:hypothetical protein
LALTWLLQGLVYSLQILYLVLGSLCGTLIYKVLKIKTIRPSPSSRRWSPSAHAQLQAHLPYKNSLRPTTGQ